MSVGDIKLSVGTSISVAPEVPANYTLGGFGGLDYTEVGEVQSIGEFGGTATITNFIPLKSGIVKKRKGSIDYGTAAMVIGELAGDEGQAMLKDGFDGPERNTVHSFKLVDQDGEVAYFTGVIASFTKNVGDANTVTTVSCNIELDNRVLTDIYDQVS